MPIAGMVGSDISTNFLNCTLQTMKSYTGFAMDPIYQNFGILTDIVSNIMDTINDLRGAVTGASSGFLGIIKSTFGKIQNTIQNTVQLFGRVRTLMNRLMAVFAVMMNIVSTGVQTGESVKRGPVGQAADFFCFHPETPISTVRGTVSIKDVRPGDSLIDGQFVRSVLEFDGSETKMYSVGSIVVSGNHKIWNEKWIRVEDHPLAVPAPPCDRLWCLNTDNHFITIGGFKFKDYEETSDPNILSEFFRKVELHYGYFHSPLKESEPEKYCYTGVAPTESLVLTSGAYVKAGDVKIGDLLKYGGRVGGIVRHRVDGSTTYLGATIAPGTWVFCEHGVVPITEKKTEEPQEYVQFITELCQYAVVGIDDAEFIVLDDHEVPDDEIHTWRDNEIQKGL
jgi:hypothetical protein